MDDAQVVAIIAAILLANRTRDPITIAYTVSQAVSILEKAWEVKTPKKS